MVKDKAEPVPHRGPGQDPLAEEHDDVEERDRPEGPVHSPSIHPAEGTGGQGLEEPRRPGTPKF
ncbi:hypothetical protein [Arenibaculum pallidiluteum]|uniref:hypothetical protein n=1 Tax=Arenibaculum pallidiluteum TaxID=2812559 RepID=UPI001A97CDD1|nr:hypothetical protein [Arenibaculum pallidiluteum]